MMICNKCGKENAESSKYCSACGNRLDGKKTCPFCNTEIEEDSVYCTNCGKRIDGKKICPSCGNEMKADEKFCSVCGYGNNSGVNQTVLPVKNKINGDTLFFYLKNGLALLAMLFAFIGTFVIGYKTLGVNVTLISNYSKTAMSLIPKTVKGIMIAFQVLAILGTATVLSLASVSFVLKKQNTCKYMFTALLLFLLPVALTLSAFVGTLTVDGTKVSIVLSDATIAFVVLCLMFAVASFVLSIITSVGKNGESILPKIFNGATLFVLCIAVLSFGFTAFKEAITTTSNELTSNIGVFGAFGDALDEPLAKLGLSLLIIGLAVMIGSGVFKAFNFDKSSLSCGFVGLVLQIVAFICMFFGLVNGVGKNAETMSASYYFVSIKAEYIVGMCISLIACGLNITHIVLKKKAKNK